MDRLIERERVPAPTAIARCREVLSEEGRDLSDDDVDAIRRHADVMAHTLIDLFLRARAQARG
jgi:hypothetical protein